MQIEIKKQLQCKRCDYEWNPRKTDVRVCPKCHSAYWDRDKETKKERTGKTTALNPQAKETMEYLGLYVANCGLSAYDDCNASLKLINDFLEGQ